MGRATARRRLLAIAACATVLVAGTLMAAGPVRAGGWWNYIDPGGPVWAPGLHVHARAGQVLFPTPEAVERALARSPYHAYLLDGFDFAIVDRAMRKADPGDWWDLGGATALRLGPVVLRDPEANLVRAGARLTVPDVAPGRYALMFCDLGCRRPLAGVIPWELTVMDDPVVADLARRVERVGERADRRHWALEGKVRKLNRRVDRLASALDDRASPSDRASSQSRTRSGATALPVLLGWAGIASAVGAGVLVVRRRRAASLP